MKLLIFSPFVNLLICFFVPKGYALGTLWHYSPSLWQLAPVLDSLPRYRVVCVWQGVHLNARTVSCVSGFGCGFAMFVIRSGK
jgi:hypothetical protein